MSRNHRPRGGFTLVELLMAIVIIGMLAALTTVAVRFGLTRAKITALQIELDQLSQGMQGYKAQAGDYPPSFGDTNQANEGDYVAMKRFIEHLRYVFPRYSPVGGTIEEQYANVRAEIAENYKIKNPANPDNIISLNLDGLVLNRNGAGEVNYNSQAEAMVFWLAGMPMPVDTLSGGNNQLIGPNKLYGFNTDGFNPFRFSEGIPSNASVSERRQMMLNKRTRRNQFFEFNEARLVDVDKDGWWEYAPPHEDGSGIDAHPYVYFDYRTYARPGAGAMSPNGSATNSPGYRPYIHPVILDRCVPYAQAIVKGQDLNFVNGSNILWMGERSFQIISAGLDSRYGLPQEAKYFALVPNAQSDNRYVAGGYLVDGSSNMKAFSNEEGDNQVSFSPALIQDVELK